MGCSERSNGGVRYLAKDIKDRVRTGFGAVAENYVRSEAHARGEDLRRMVELARLRGDERVLDVATGGGHTALAFAPHAREVVASDLTPQMLEAAASYVRDRGAANVSFVHADAEALPFADASFDVVTCRIAPHHFPDARRFVGEVARVLVPGGRFLLDDNVAPEEPQLDEFMNRFERWRDPGHVRARTLGEWRAWIEESGMQIEHAETARKPYVFEEWTARIGMPEGEREALSAWLAAAPPECREFFEISVEDGRVVALSGLFAIVVSRRQRP
jgi:ubiquinone/menaquinone biosynthesis C-methylase UbiE